MRAKLKALMNKKRPTFSATFDKYGVKTVRGYTIRTALLKNVKYNGRLVADHAWIKNVSGLIDLGVEKGDIVQFQASVLPYVRGYLGFKPVSFKRTISVDYELAFPSDFKKL